MIKVNEPTIDRYNENGSIAIQENKSKRKSSLKKDE